MGLATNVTACYRPGVACYRQQMRTPVRCLPTHPSTCERQPARAHLGSPPIDPCNSRVAARIGPAARRARRLCPRRHQRHQWYQLHHRACRDAHRRPPGGRARCF
eukprot:6266318-Prymnesium_polylepis.2